jgi:hypothetical protein
MKEAVGDEYPGGTEHGTSVADLQDARLTTHDKLRGGEVDNVKEADSGKQEEQERDSIDVNVDVGQALMQRVQPIHCMGLITATGLGRSGPRVTSKFVGACCKIFVRRMTPS